MISCILTSHMKPTLGEAIESVLAQTRQDFRLVVVDSGQWYGKDDEISRQMRQFRAQYQSHPRISWHETGEPPDLRLHKCPVAWAANLAIRSGWVRGRYVCTFYDDDLYYPTFFERMAGFLDEHPEHLAVWCSQDRLVLGGDPRGVIRADGPKHPGEMDCQVDGAQVMFRRKALDLIGDPWLPENPMDFYCRHSDGIFLEKLATVAGSIPAIPDTLLAHRFTPYSTYSPSR